MVSCVVFVPVVRHTSTLVLFSIIEVEVTILVEPVVLSALCCQYFRPCLISVSSNLSTLPSPEDSFYLLRLAQIELKKESQ
jgi:hypothetical protein